MVYREEVKNINKMGIEWALACFISADGILNSRTARELVNNFGAEEILQEKLAECRFTNGYCITVDRLFFLVVKQNYFDRPSFLSIKKALENAKAELIDSGYKSFAMPVVAASSDLQDWYRIVEIIKRVFGDTDIEVCVCKDADRRGTG